MRQLTEIEYNLAPILSDLVSLSYKMSGFIQSMTEDPDVPSYYRESLLQLITEHRTLAKKRNEICDQAISETAPK